MTGKTGALMDEPQMRMIADTIPGLLSIFYARTFGERGLYYTSGRSEKLYGISPEPATFFPKFTAGTVTFSQDEPSSVVFGIPGVAVKRGAALYVMPPENIADMIAGLVSRSKNTMPARGPGRGV